MSLKLHDSKYDSVPPVPPVQSFCYAFVMGEYTHLLGTPRVQLAWYPGSSQLAGQLRDTFTNSFIAPLGAVESNHGRLKCQRPSI